MWTCTFQMIVNMYEFCVRWKINCNKYKKNRPLAKRSKRIDGGKGCGPKKGAIIDRRT